MTDNIPFNQQTPENSIIICECDRIKLKICGYIRTLNIDISIDITGVIFSFYDSCIQWSEMDVSPRQYATKLRNWLIYRGLNENDLKQELLQCNFLTNKRLSFQRKIKNTYNQRYGYGISNLMDDISNIIKNGPFLELIDGLFRTRIEFDAYCIDDIIKHQTNEIAVVDVADILCCRNMNELQLICDEYKRMYGFEMRDKIYKLSSSITYGKVINHMFAFKKSENERTIKQNAEYLMDGNIDWKNVDDVNKLILMVLINNEDYIRDLNAVFLKESNMNLIHFIDEKIGEPDVLIKWIKVKIAYCLDSNEFYAKKIIKIGDNDGWNKKKAITNINRIFRSTFDTKLKNIQNTFNKMDYGNGKSMIEWITTTCNNDKYALLLTQMLQTCKCKLW